MVDGHGPTLVLVIPPVLLVDQNVLGPTLIYYPVTFLLRCAVQPKNKLLKNADVWVVNMELQWNCVTVSELVHTLRLTYSV